MRNSENKPYLVRLDARSRITLREAGYSFYRAKNYNNGCIFLTPCVVAPPENLSRKMLNMIEKRIESIPIRELKLPLNLEKFIH